MAIVKNPKRNRSEQADASAEAFISKAGSGGTGVPIAAPPMRQEDRRENKVQITLRIDPALLVRVDRASRRLGISRAGFLAMSAAEKLEGTE